MNLRQLVIRVDNWAKKKIGDVTNVTLMNVCSVMNNLLKTLIQANGIWMMRNEKWITTQKITRYFVDAFLVIKKRIVFVVRIKNLNARLAQELQNFKIH